MEYKSETQKGVAKFEFTVSKAEWDEEINSAYIKTRGKYNVAGFRRGHAPRKFIENIYGPTVFFDDAFNSCASKAYAKALTENPELYPVSEPKVDITKFENDKMEFTIEVTLKPEVKLGQYKGLTLKKAEYPVSDADVDADIDRARNSKSRLVEVTDRAAKDGDTVTIDYSGSVDGVKFNGGTAQNQDLTLGSHSFIPGFEEQVAGMKIGEQKDLKVKFPDDYHAEDLKGKDAVFAVTLHGIKYREVPELTDEFVKDTTKFETVAEYKADVKKRLEENAARRAENENKNNVIDAVVANATVDVPECMVDTELDYMLGDLEHRLSHMYGGMKIEDYFKYTGTSAEDFRKDRKPDAEKNVKTRLVVEALVKTEKIEPTDEEVDARVAEYAAPSGKSVEEYKSTLDSHTLSHIKSDATVEKLLGMLCDATVFESDAKKEPAKKTTAAKTTAAKPATSTAAKKAPAKKTEPKEEK